jgi:hypothetical protein
VISRLSTAEVQQAASNELLAKEGIMEQWLLSRIACLVNPALLFSWANH